MFYLVLIIAFIGMTVNYLAYAGIARKKGAFSTGFYRSISLSILMSPLLLFANFNNISLNYLAAVFIIGIIGATGFFIQLKAYEYLPVGLVSALKNLYNIIIIALAYLIYNETLSVIGYIGAITILISLISLSLIKSHHKHLKKGYIKGLILVGLRVITYAIWLFSFAYFSREVDLYTSIYLSEFSVLIGFLPFFLFYKGKEEFARFSNKDILKLFSITIFPALSSFGIFYASTLGKISIVTLTLSTVPIVVSLLGHFLWKENLKPLQWLLIITSTIGLIMINL